MPIKHAAEGFLLQQTTTAEGQPLGDCHDWYRGA